MKELLKTVAKTAEKKEVQKPVKAAKSTKAVKHAKVSDKDAPYRLLSSDKSLFAAFTAAAFIHANAVSMSPKGALSSRKGGDMEFWGKMVGSSASGYWKKKGLVDDGGVTAVGLNVLSNRMKDQGGAYRTTPDKVRELVALLKTGGPLKVKGQEVSFSFEV
jgi:hypothetical protein